MKYLGQFNVYVNEDDNSFTLKELDGWISVKDRLPEHGEYVLFHTTSSTFLEIGFLPKDERVWLTHDESYSLSTVTHWQPLPPAPKDNT
jgi:hypothetical protein